MDRYLSAVLMRKCNAPTSVLLARNAQEAYTQLNCYKKINASPKSIDAAYMIRTSSSWQACLIYYMLDQTPACHYFEIYSNISNGSVQNPKSSPEINVEPTRYHIRFENAHSKVI